MDAGRTVDGVASMRAAIRLAWELETEQWPAQRPPCTRAEEWQRKATTAAATSSIWASSAGGKSRYHCAGSAVACAALLDDQFCAIVDGFAVGVA